MKIVYSADEVLDAILDDVDTREMLKNVLGSDRFVARFVIDINDEMTGEIEVCPKPEAILAEVKPCQSA